MSDHVDAERSLRLICEECGCESDPDAGGWEGHLGVEDDGTETVAFFCPDCVAELR